MMRDALVATKLAGNRARMLSGILVGLGCLAVSILALVSYLFGPALYHLFRLQREPGYFAKLLDDPRGGEVRMQAVRWFIQSEQGKQALFRLYAWDAIATVLDANRGPPEDLRSGVIWIDAKAWGFVVMSDGTRRPSGTLQVPRARLALIEPLLELIEGKHFVFPEYPGLWFTLHSRLHRSGVWGVAQDGGEKRVYRCLIALCSQGGAQPEDAAAEAAQ